MPEADVAPPPSTETPTQELPPALAAATAHKAPPPKGEQSLTARLYRKVADKISAEPKPEIKKDEKPVTPPKPKATKPTPSPAPAAPAPDYREMGDTIATSIREGLKGVMPAKATEPDRKADLGHTEKRMLSAIEHLEKTKPDLYAGRSTRYLDQIKQEQEYADKWTSENPGKDYNPDDPEHEAFQKGNNLDDIDQDDLESAREAVMRREIKEELKQEMEKEIMPLAAKVRLQDEAPAILQTRLESSNVFFDGLRSGDDKVLSETGDPRAEAKTNAAGGVIMQMSERVELFADQLHRLVRQLPARPKPTNPREPYVAPEEIEAFVDNSEQYLRALPQNLPIQEGGQLDEQGRRFATAEEYEKMTRDQKARHWRLDDQKISRMFAAEQAVHAKSFIRQREEELERFAKAKGYTRNGEPPPTTPSASPPTIVASPPGAIAPQSAPPTAKNGPGNEVPKSGWLGSLYRRK